MCFPQEVPLLLLSEKSGTEDSAVSRSPREPHPGDSFLRRKLRAHSCFLVLGVGPAAGGRGQAYRVRRPSQTLPWLSPAQLSTKLWRKERLCVCKGKNESKFQKGSLLSILQQHEWKSFPRPPRSSRSRKQKFCGSLGACEPTDHRAQGRDSKRDGRLCLPLSGVQSPG